LHTTSRRLIRAGWCLRRRRGRRLRHKGWGCWWTRGDYRSGGCRGDRLRRLSRRLRGRRGRRCCSFLQKI
jgi:hypothetical protein